MGNYHELKSIAVFFEAVVDGSKTFEIRKDDRGYSQGDLVKLREYDAAGRQYTGRELMFRIGFVSAYAQAEGYVVFSLLPVEEGGRSLGPEGLTPSKAELERMAREEADENWEEVERLKAKNQKLKDQLGEYETAGDPVGWEIVAVAKHSVLCQSKTGSRRRYFFGDWEKAIWCGEFSDGPRDEEG